MTKSEIELVVMAYTTGMARGADHVLDLIDDGFTGDALRERVMRRIEVHRDRYQAGLEAFESLREDEEPKAFPLQ
jgi:hypothetical protein